MTPGPDRKYTDAEEVMGLQLGAARGRNAACRELGISKSLFQKWTERHPREWSEALQGRGGDFQKELAVQFEELAENYTEAEQKAIAAALTALEDTTDPKELAALIKAMGSSRGLASVNARQARGEPDKSFDLNINFPQLEQAAERILAAAPSPPAIDVTAEEDHG